jgi:hypothetical protein
MSVIKEKQLPDISISKITGLQGELNNKATIGNDGKVIPEQLPASFSGEGIGIDGFYRNAIINGNFDIWQRGISFTAMGYAADRWRIHGIGSTKTYSRQAFSVGQTEVPNNPTYFARIEVASVVGTGNYVLSVQRIENVTKLSGKTITVSFWAKSDAVKNICVEFTQNIGGSGFNTISPTTMTLSTTWKKYTVTTTLPSLAGKTNRPYRHCRLPYH